VATYVPRFLKKRRHARKVDIVVQPLFPSYFFVSVDTAIQQWRCIASTIGVARLVCNGDAPAPVPMRVIDALKQREDERGFIHIERQLPFVHGDKIRVVNGPFSSCLGIFEDSTDAERVTILLDLLGRKVRLALDADLIGAA
jgi:transcriptional antiterminator RfaH